MISRGRFELTVIARGITSGRETTTVTKLRSEQIGTSGIHHVFCSNDDSHQIRITHVIVYDCIWLYPSICPCYPYYSILSISKSLLAAKVDDGSPRCCDGNRQMRSWTQRMQWSRVSPGIQLGFNNSTFLKGYSIWLHMATYGYIWLLYMVLHHHATLGSNQVFPWVSTTVFVFSFCRKIQTNPSHRWEDLQAICNKWLSTREKVLMNMKKNKWLRWSSQFCQHPSRGTRRWQRPISQETSRL